MQRLILDANILINYCSTNEETHKQVEEIFEKLFNNELIIFLPDLAYYEFIYNLKKQKLSEELLIFLDNFIKNPNTYSYKMDDNEFIEITKISLKYNLSTYDATYLFLSIAT
jgi:predicted nucleic acid-binding protein